MRCVTLLALLTAACTGTPPAVAPEGLPPLPAASGWSADVRPDEPTVYRLRWRFTNQQGSAAGRAVVRFQPPDSLRFDYNAPFGRSGAAMFVGPEAIWAVPEEEVQSLVPAAPLFWAGIGLPLDPPAGVIVRGRETDGERLWRYEDGTEAWALAWRPTAGTFLAELRYGERLVGTADVRYDSSGTASTATLRFPGDAAQLTFRFEAVEPGTHFDPATWRRP